MLRGEITHSLHFSWNLFHNTQGERNSKADDLRDESLFFSPTWPSPKDSRHKSYFDIMGFGEEYKSFCFSDPGAHVQAESMRLYELRISYCGFKRATSLDEIKVYDRKQGCGEKNSGV